MVFKDKQTVKLVMTSKDSPLKFHDRLVYSYLVYRSRVNQSANKKEIAAGVSITYEAVTGALVTLSRYNLVAKQGLDWTAMTPVGDAVTMFVYHDKASSWQRSFKSIPVYLPSKDSPLKIRTLAILSVMFMVEKKNCIDRMSDSYLAAALGMTEGCVADHRSVLVARQVIAVEARGRGYVVGLYDPTDYLDWLADRPAKVAAKESAVSSPLMALFRGHKVRPCDLDLESGDNGGHSKAEAEDNERSYDETIVQRGRSHVLDIGALSQTGIDFSDMVVSGHAVRGEVGRSTIGMDDTIPRQASTYVCPFRRVACQSAVPCPACREVRRTRQLLMENS